MAAIPMADLVFLIIGILVSTILLYVSATHRWWRVFLATMVVLAAAVAALGYAIQELVS